MSKVVMGLVVMYLPVLGQSPQSSSVTKSPGETVTFEIRQESASPKAPVALEWEVVFPAQLMEMESTAPETGTAAKDSGKTLECSQRKSYVYACVLSGGPNPLAKGVIAVFRFKIFPTAAAGRALIRVEKAVATMADSKVVTWNTAEAVVTIR